jgi:hypothetical protein
MEVLTLRASIMQADGCRLRPSFVAHKLAQQPASWANMPSFSQVAK